MKKTSMSWSMWSTSAAFALLALGTACGAAGGGGGSTAGSGATGVGAHSTCTPSCAGKACGDDDGCSGVCEDGACPSGQVCVSGTCESGTSGGTVPPGGSCASDSDCDASACSSAGAQCLDWHDGKGYVCSCDCSWGDECNSGCCRIPKGGSVGSCGNPAACKNIGQSCTDNEQCLNNDCGGFLTYCYDGNFGGGPECGCGCSSNSDCKSGCCAPYSLGGDTIYACSAPGTPGC